jgi:di/tricarboxylate transporter
MLFPLPEAVQIAIVLALVAVVFFGFIREIISPDVLAMVAVAVLLLFAILPIDDVLAVFSNPAPVTIGCLLVLSAALERTGVIEVVGNLVKRVPWQSPTVTMAVMAILVAGASAFVNNTPLVVLLTPVMIAFAHSRGVAPSRFLIPLSYAAIFGGTCTLIGTSTNILVDGVIRNHGLEPLHIFEISSFGIVMALIGIAYMALFGRWLLPDRQTLADVVIDLPPRKFLAEAVVPPESPLIGRTLTEAGLTYAKGVHVIDFIRDEVSFDPQYGEPTLKAGDRMVIRTQAGDMLSLRNGGGVVFEAENEAEAGHEGLEPIAQRSATMMEGIIGPNSRFVGQRVADLNLRRLYGTYILAIHRQNEALHGDFDQVRLAFGDTLLLEGPAEGLRRLFDTHELVNLSEVGEQPFRRDKAWIAVLALVGVVALAGSGLLPMAGVSLIAATVVVAFGCLDVEDAYRAVDWRMLMLIFGMLALGSAMDKTGAGGVVVEFLVGLVAALGPVAVLSMIYAITSVLTEFMSNNAAAILLTPIAIGLAEHLGVDPRPFVIAVMFAASASFATPIGYQTNTFVFTAGGYRFSDFVRIGLPLNIINWAAASLLLPLFWPIAP